MRKVNLKGNEKGFTLIEVLIAIAFMMVMVVGIVMAISTSSRILARANNQEIAKDIASGVMVNIRTQGYASSYSLPPTPTEYSNFTVDVDSVSNKIVTKFLRTNQQQIDIVVRLKGNIIFTLTDYRTSY